MNNSTNSQLESVISAISLINTALSIPIELPMAKKNVQFRQLTTAQEKRLIKDLLTNKNQTFLAAILPILKENCEDSSLDLESLTIADLYAILLKIRIYSIGEELSLKIPYKAKSGTFTTQIHLLSIYDQLINHIKNIGSMDFQITDNPYIVHCSIPKVKEIIESSSEKVETFYDTLFLETARMVTKFEIVASDEQHKEIDMGQFSMEEKMKILESLPNSTLTKVYFESIKKIQKLRDLMLFDFEFEGQKYKQTIDLTSSDFFTVF